MLILGLVLGSFKQTAIDALTYGNYCGSNHGLTEILADPECLERLFTTDDCIPPIDYLDFVCFWHDMCFRYSKQQYGYFENCDCNKAILDADYNFAIPLPISYNQTDGTVIFDNNTMWEVPGGKQASELFYGSPLKWAKDDCASFPVYDTTADGDPTVKEALDNTQKKCNAAGLVADQLFPEMKCTCNGVFSIKSSDIPSGGCPAILANPPEDRTPYSASVSLTWTAALLLFPSL